MPSGRLQGLKSTNTAKGAGPQRPKFFHAHYHYAAEVELQLITLTYVKTNKFTLRVHPVPNQTRNAGHPRTHIFDTYRIPMQETFNL